MPIWKEHMTCKCNFSCCYKSFFSKSYSFIHGDKHKSPNVSELLCYAVCHFTAPESHLCLFCPSSDSCTLSLFVFLFSAGMLLCILFVHLSSSKEQNSLFLFHCFCHRSFCIHFFCFVFSYSVLCWQFYTSHIIHFQFSLSFSRTSQGAVSKR